MASSAREGERQHRPSQPEPTAQEPGSERDFRTFIQSGTLLGDGAMATLLHQHGVPVRACSEALCLTRPSLVADVHRAYVHAGAGLLQTHTFSAHRPGLARYGLESEVASVNRAAVEVARAAGGGHVFVFGTVGSIAGLGGGGFPDDAATRRQYTHDFGEQVEALLASGVDGILLETFAELTELLAALRVVRSLTDLPVIAHLSPSSPGVTRDGVAIADAFNHLLEHGADVVGLNCGLGPSGILRSYEGLHLDPGVAYGAVPNAGLLHMVDGDYSFTGSADYFADVACALRSLGVRFIGGCCGTTPEHIRRAAAKLAAVAVDPAHGAPGRGTVAASSTPGLTGASAVSGPVTGPGTLGMPAASEAARVAGTPGVPAAAGVSRASGGSLAMGPSADVDAPAGTSGEGGAREDTLVDLVRRRVTVMVELDPPKTLDCAKFLEGAAALRRAGADFVTMADNSLASARVSNLALASLLKRMGIEPLVHVTCRDRNLIGQQSHLMGLHVLGVRHILLVTGDPSRFGDLPGATSVYDVSSTELTRMVKRLNAGLGFSGQTLRQPARFVVGTSFNPNVANFDKAVDRLRRKVEAGADFVMTQPLFDKGMLERIARAAEGLGVPVFAGVMPLVSGRNALFLHHEVPGIRIPDEVLRRMCEAPDPETALREGMAIARETVEAAMDHFNGIYLVTPFLRYELTVALTEHVREVANRRERSATA
ncbi:MAG: bifunctional homocysteine S-methyltransferase/methylenetetrahydrofolate reductase [Alicyclobacillus sp.]|nr:bifunctional homocysteine S-methyltransferase/methylenetetrahydrofolate reductase [Alicyclobacillus sp.]